MSRCPSTITKSCGLLDVAARSSRDSAVLNSPAPARVADRARKALRLEGRTISLFQKEKRKAKLAYSAENCNPAVFIGRLLNVAMQQEYEPDKKTAIPSSRTAAFATSGLTR